MEKLTYKPIKFDDENALAVIDLSAKDLMDNGKSEDEAKAAVGVGTQQALDNQHKKFDRDPHSYFGAYSGEDLKAMLKITHWNKGDMENYALNSMERSYLQTSRRLGFAALLGNPFGVQAFVSANDIDRAPVMSDLLAFGIDHLESGKAIYAPHHGGDMAELALVDNGFVKTKRHARVVDLKTGRLEFEQDLYLRKAA